MTVTPLVPDLGAEGPQPSAGSNDSVAFGKVLSQIGDALDRAESAEDRFATGIGDLQSAVIARARADVALSIATAAAGRAAQALSQLLNMQI